MNNVCLFVSCRWRKCL